VSEYGLAMPPKAALTPGESCVLALLVEARRHGWGIAAILARDGELGAIWSMARPLVYTSLRRLEAEGYIRTVGLERGERGPHRVIFEATPQGRKATRAWLCEPVERVREIRSLFLLKVVLAQRLGVDPEPLLVKQRALMAPFVGWLEVRLEDVDPEADPTEATVLHFRFETAQTTIRFIDHMLANPRAAKPRARRKANR
jgi:DNA-binding PadR family transcriptional regulator